MQIDKVIENIKKLYSAYTEEEFIYQFIDSFSFYPKNTIARLKGDRNLSKNKNELLWKDKIFYVNSKNIDTDIHILADNLKRDKLISQNKIRFLIITNFNLFLSIDIKTSQSLECKFVELHKFIDFFLPLTGVEKFITVEENPADIKATNNLGKLYDEILKNNKNFYLKKNKYSLNIFFTRLLFLYYADDSGIFEKNLFLQTITDYTKSDGSDLDNFFYKLFEVLKVKKLQKISSYLEKFPYVNGFLFKEPIKLPIFTNKSRDMILNNGSLDWQNINPDILGSMLQEVVSKEEREDGEMHYTSVPNILKILDPLILNKLKKKVKEAEDDEDKLKKLLKYIYSLKILDPACGSGNFLIVAYKQLYLIEIEIIKKLKEVNPNNWLLTMPGIKLSQFYGIEKSHFATETAKLSLWLAEHQMNFFYKDIFEKIKPSLPIEDNVNIVCDNSISYDWKSFFKKEKKDSSIFIIGNPPFKSFANRTEEQKNDVINYLGKKSKIDYVGLWFLKASDFSEFFIKTKTGFVATNSINQGEQVEMIWEKILNKGFNIFFAHKSFNWKNNARNNATVTVSIVCFAKKHEEIKQLVIDEQLYNVQNINPYLIAAPNIIIKKTKQPIFDLPKMTDGEMPRDDGNLLLNLKEKNDILSYEPKAEKLIRPYMGGEEFIDGKKRWCLWIKHDDLKLAESVVSIKKRLEKVRTFRSKSDNATTKGFADKPYRFVEIRKQENDSIFMPKTTSSTREYVPVGYGDKEIVLSNALKVIYSPPIYFIAILSSKIHNVWFKNIGGRLKNDVQYSTEVVYYNFPLPKVDEEHKKKLTDLSYKLLDYRDKFFDKTISFLYNINTMPNTIKEIHREIDICVDNIYSKKFFLNDNERLAFLFNLYAKKTLNMDLFQ